jgi:hypothetical protein
MLRTVVATAALFGLCSSASAGNYLPDCPEGTRLPTKSVALMTMPSDSGIEGNVLRGTVWFISRQQIVAILHEHSAVLEDWTEITLETGNAVGFTPSETTVTYARISHVIDSGSLEKLYIIDLAEIFDDSEVPRVRFGAPSDNEAVFSLTYNKRVLTLVTGRHVLPKQSTDPEQKPEPPPPFLMFELADPQEKDRMVVDFGSSGSPIFDCNGLVVASVAKVMTQDFAGERVSTAWGDPNVFGTPTGMIIVP